MVFGSLAYMTDLVNIDKFKPRLLPCIFLGYPNNQKGYILLDLETDRLLISRHMHFVENRFPFKENKGNDQGEVSNEVKEIFWFDTDVENRIFGNQQPINEEFRVNEQQRQGMNENIEHDVLPPLGPNITGIGRDRRPPIWAICVMGIQNQICTYKGNK